MVINSKELVKQRKENLIRNLIDRSNEESEQVVKAFAQKFGIYIINQDRYIKLRKANITPIDDNSIWDTIFSRKCDISDVFRDFLNEEGRV